ncbi:hypothetical protein VPH35_107637 [Triticum aestivum]
MATPSDAHSATSDGGGSGGLGVAKSDLECYFDQLDLNEEDFDDVVIEEDNPELEESARWLALARVHTSKGFSPTAFYKEMQAAWNPTHEVRFRPVGPNRYVSIMRGKERQVYLIRYEKLAWFCKVCGLVGHEYKECGRGVHAEKDMKFGEWLYADVPNKPRVPNEGKPSSPPSGNHPREEKCEARKTGRDMDTEDTTYSPIKPHEKGDVATKESRKRLNMDEAVVTTLGMAGTPKTILAITDGLGKDMSEDGSPTSSNYSKRARVSKSEENDDLSAASLEEDRRAQ